MPNWCDCELTARGPASEVARFLDGLTRKADDPTLVALLNSYVPIPQPLRDAASGSQELGYEILYTDKWRTIAGYAFLRALTRDGEPAATREQTWQLFVGSRRNWNPAPTEAEMRATADRYKQNFEDYGYITWYEWAQAEWGSKWGDCNTRITAQTPRSVSFAFESPWTPPMGGLHKIAGLFSLLTFDLRYWEGGAGFQGQTLWQRGEVRADVHADYSGPRGG